MAATLSVEVSTALAAAFAAMAFSAMAAPAVIT